MRCRSRHSPATTPSSSKVAADANGEVVISNVSGTIDVRGWDRNEVQVTGHLGGRVERVDVEFEQAGAP